MLARCLPSSLLGWVSVLRHFDAQIRTINVHENLTYITSELAIYTLFPLFGFN